MRDLVWAIDGPTIPVFILSILAQRALVVVAAWIGSVFVVHHSVGAAVAIVDRFALCAAVGHIVRGTGVLSFSGRSYQTSIFNSQQ